MFTSTVSIPNESDDPLIVLIEPWGVPLRFGPGSILRAVAEGQAEGTLEVTTHPTNIVLSAWPSATIVVFIDDAEIYRSEVCVPPGLRVGPAEDEEKPRWWQLWKRRAAAKSRSGL